jgi:hypothetical protein
MLDDLDAASVSMFGPWAAFAEFIAAPGFDAPGFDGRKYFCLFGTDHRTVLAPLRRSSLPLIQF